MKNFSFKTRAENLEKFKDLEFDLIVIGGGINGAGVARDAALRGMSVALIEERDFASGTSSKSSKLIHGGIRYLENMEFKLVFEALNERTKLFEMAPHLIHPLRFMIPIYQSSRVGMMMMGLGMWLYDALSLFQAPKFHERLNAKETLKRMPTLEGKELLGSYVYSDAYMDDDRLVIETLRSANENGAVIASYVKAVGYDFSSDSDLKTVTCVDQKNGEVMALKGRHVISTVGPWTDEVASTMFSNWKKILRPTKGIHLTFRKDRLPLSSAVVMGAEKGTRIVFGIPRHEMIIIGTTDTDYKDHPQNVTVTPEDVNYLLEVTEQYFPGAKLQKEDIVASYAGVRPLVQDGSDSEGKTSREHTIISIKKQGVTFVAGGKYTTYRLMCEEAVDKALRSFPFEDQMYFAKVNTAKALNPMVTSDLYHQAIVEHDQWAKDFEITESDARKLAERYGMEAKSILKSYPKGLTYWQYEAAHAIDKEMCMDLVDFYTRRSSLYLAESDHGLRFLEEIVDVFRIKLVWTLEQGSAQIDRLQKFIEQDLSWKEKI